MIHILFFIGKISLNEIKQIKLAKQEIADYEFVSIKDSNKYNSKFAKYARKYYEKIINGENFGYLEEYPEDISKL